MDDEAVQVGRSGLGFAELRDARQQLVDLCKRHVASVERFRAPKLFWFLLSDKERITDTESSSVSHLSTSASCLESLLDADATPTDLINGFARGALGRTFEQWQSERGAHTYCRVRTLPLIIERADASLLETHLHTLERHIEAVWTDVTPEPGRQGIREHKPSSLTTDALPTDKTEDHYPPNAFLTYWGLRVLESVDRRGIGIDTVVHREKQVIAQLWAQRTLAAQIALHTQSSDFADPHQLAWAISTMMRFAPREELRQPANVELIRAGLQAMFAQQHPNGGWPRGQPLFHYPESGNAYCYLYETLTELLRLAVRRPVDDEANLIAVMLRPFAPRLLQTAALARDTQVDLGGGAVGWCSHHHPQRTDPESWASASAFSFLQKLRALVGVWTADAARRALGARTPKEPRVDKAMSLLATRGSSWKVQGWSAADHLASLFVHPLTCREAKRDTVDPDSRLVPTEHARSAILFGPPGTSKTTLVEAVAGAVGWSFVELHASDFLSNGMNGVAGRADEIFRYVMELDRCVVLFDEIDELLRDRGGEASDPFGRFLTTSMLPKLAKLWDQKRVLFFVNTNWVEEADPAIKRSQRFDGAIFVLPPDFESKAARVRPLLEPEARRKLTERAVTRALENNSGAIGWFALLRHDQLDELEARLRQRPVDADSVADFDDFTAALTEMGDQLRASDWHISGSDKEPFERYRQLVASVRFDYGRQRFLRLDHKVEDVPDGYLLAPGNAHDEVTYLVLPPELQAPPATIETASWVGRHTGALCYTVLMKPPTSSPRAAPSRRRGRTGAKKSS